MQPLNRHFCVFCAGNAWSDCGQCEARQAWLDYPRAPATRGPCPRGSPAESDWVNLPVAWRNPWRRAQPPA
eukprot:733731-Alexandrium_andersonii.AAC.1